MERPHPSPTEIYLCRHGETDWTLTGQHTSRTDLALTEAGIQQAHRLRDRLKGISFAHVFTSPLLRARQTCEALGLTDRAELWPDLMEWDYGAYEGVTRAQIQQSVPGWTIFTHGAPQGETPEAIGQRVQRVLHRIRTLQGPVVLFSHGHFLRVLGALWIGLSVEGGASLDLDTAALCTLGKVHDSYAIKLWNETWFQR